MSLASRSTASNKASLQVLVVLVLILYQYQWHDMPESDASSGASSGFRNLKADWPS